MPTTAAIGTECVAATVLCSAAAPGLTIMLTVRGVADSATHVAVSIGSRTGVEAVTVTGEATLLTMACGPEATRTEVTKDLGGQPDHER